MTTLIHSTDSAGFGASGTRLLADQLQQVVKQWATSQHQLVVLAAEFADGDEWAVAGSPTASHWLAHTADVEPCTAREWIRIGRKLRTLPVIAEAFADGRLSYSKIRALTRLATADNETELVDIALTVAARDLGRALAVWLKDNTSPKELDEPDQQWPTVAQQHADALEHVLTAGGGSIATEVVLHVRADGCTLDDGTPIAGSVVERIAPQSFLRALIHDAQSSG